MPGKFLALLPGLILLTGCGLKTANLQNTDWYKIGYNEAKSGITKNWRQNYHVVYGGAPASFDVNAYMQGFEKAVADMN